MIIATMLVMIMILLGRLSPKNSSRNPFIKSFMQSMINMLKNSL